MSGKMFHVEDIEKIIEATRSSKKPKIFTNERGEKFYILTEDGLVFEEQERQ